jgi:hypothetical protein
MGHQTLASVESIDFHETDSTSAFVKSNNYEPSIDESKRFRHTKSQIERTPSEKNLLKNTFN